MSKRHVNIYLDEEQYVILVKESARRMQTTGKPWPIGTLVRDLISPVIANLDNKQEDPPKTTNPDSEQKPKSQLARAFSEIDF